MQKSSARCPQGNLAGRMLQVFPKTGDSSTDQFMLSLSQQGKPSASTTDKKIVRASNSKSCFKDKKYSSTPQPPQPPVINTGHRRWHLVAFGGMVASPWIKASPCCFAGSCVGFKASMAFTSCKAPSRATSVPHWPRPSNEVKQCPNVWCW